MKTDFLCSCGQYPIYPGSDECGVCDGSYRLTDTERNDVIYSLPQLKAVALAIMCAEEVASVWDHDHTAVRAIQAAKDWLENPTSENRDIVSNAGANTANGAPYDVARFAAFAAAATTTSAGVYASTCVYVTEGYADNDVYETIDRWLYENTL